MKAVLLAGGLGTRLREETEYRPKPMVMVGGRPILWHIMKNYSHFGVRDFVVCLGYQGDVIRDYFLNYEARMNDFTVHLGSKHSVEYHDVHDESDWGVTLAETGAETMTGGRVFRVQKYVQGERFVATYGDGLADVPIDEVLKFHEAHGKLATVTTVRPVSRFGVIAFACSLEQVGPMTLTVRDAALLHQVIAADSPNDATCTGPRDAIELPTAGRFDGLRFGVPWAELEEGVEPGIRARFDESLAIAKNLGAEIVDVELPYSRHGLAAYYVIAPAEASANLSRFDGVRYGLRVGGPDIRSMYEATRDAGFGPEVKRRIMIGTYALSAGYHDAYYVQAQRVRTLIRQDFDNAFAGVDAILLPTAPTTAFPIGARLDDPLAMYANDIFTLPVNLAGIPALSLPNGLSEGLPSSLQLIGPAHSENLLLRLGAAFEAEHAFDPVPPSMRSGA